MLMQAITLLVAKVDDMYYCGDDGQEAVHLNWLRLSLSYPPRPPLRLISASNIT